MSIARPTAISASPGLIERDEPLAALAGYLDEAAAGSGRFVVIRVDPSLGTSRIEDRRSTP